MHNINKLLLSYIKSSQYITVIFSLILLVFNTSVEGEALLRSGIEPSLVITPTFTWEVHSIALSWRLSDINIESNSTKTDIDNKSTTEKSVDKKWSFGGESGVNVQAKGAVNSNPLKAFGIFDSKGGVSAAIGVWGKGDMTWNKNSIETARKCYESFTESSNIQKLSDLHLSFSISFYNNSDEDYNFEPKPLPVWINGEHIVDAYPESTGEQEIPANRPSGVSIMFKADLDTTKARALVEFMRTDAPKISLEKSQIKIHHKSNPASDAISELQKTISSTVPITLFYGNESLTWRVAVPPSSQSMTLKEALEVINIKISKIHNQKFLFIFDDNTMSKIGDSKIGSDVYFYIKKDNKFISDDCFQKPIEEPIEIGVIQKNELEEQVKFLFGNISAEGGIAKNIIFFNQNSEICKALADRDVPLAQVICGIACFFNDNKNLGFNYFSKAAEKNCSWGDFLLGICYIEGIGIKKDVSKGFDLILKVANLGNIFAEEFIGDLYFNGDLIDKDLNEAIKWLEKAASKGLSFAQVRLGYVYKSLNKNEDAKKWFSLASDQGDNEAQLELAIIHIDLNDIDGAILLTQQSADGGNAKAQYALALIYFKSESYSKAIDYLKMSVSQKYIPAIEELGRWYYTGKGVPQDRDAGLKLWMTAAQLGSPDCQNFIGTCYLDGDGLNKDEKEGFNWLLKSAKNGCSNAKFNLARCYLKGIGVEVDVHESRLWLENAAKDGNADAIKALKKNK